MKEHRQELDFQVCRKTLASTNLTDNVGIVAVTM